MGIGHSRKSITIVLKGGDPDSLERAVELSGLGDHLKEPARWTCYDEGECYLKGIPINSKLEFKKDLNRGLLPFGYEVGTGSPLSNTVFEYRIESLGGSVRPLAFLPGVDRYNLIGESL